MAKSNKGFQFAAIIMVILAILNGCSITKGHIIKDDIDVDFTTINFFMKKSLDGLTVDTPDLGKLKISGQTTDPTPAQQLALEILKAGLGAK